MKRQQTKLSKKAEAQLNAYFLPYCVKKIRELIELHKREAPETELEEFLLGVCDGVTTTLT